MTTTENNLGAVETGADAAISTDLRADLRLVCDRAFDGDASAAALALGRDKEQIAEMLSGDAEIDEDLVMKLHGLAQERNVDLGETASGTAQAGG